MPNTQSAKKRLRQNVKRRMHNRMIKSAVRTQMRKVREAVAAGDVDRAEAEFRLACKKLDRTAAKRIIHPNAAARHKSRLSAKIKQLKESQQVAS